MARPAKSARLHELHGTKPHEPKIVMSSFTGGRPRIPKHLCPAARTAYKRACKLLEERGTLVPSDEATIAVYAECHARWIQAKRELGNSLMITTEVTDSHGQVRIVTRLNPLLKVVDSTEQRLLALAKSLGLTQVDLQRCKPTARDVADEVVPGSAQDLYPECYDATGKWIGKTESSQVIPFVPLPPEENDDGTD
jgi:P27 family predicted phage terminase small subunit